MAKRVLVIEDNRTNRDLLAYLLKAGGYEVSTAVDGEEGIAAALRDLPDLIICDIQMPKMDGMAVARCLKERRETQRIPLIAVTALAMVGDRDRVMSAQFDGYLAKPIEPETFAAQVADFLARGSVRAALQPERRPAPPAPARAPEPRPAPAPAAPRKGGATILVVDDSVQNIDVFRQSLAGTPHRIVACARSGEAEALARRLRPDLIVCDIHMRELDGFDLLTALQADPDLRGIRFVFLSSTVWPERDSARGLGLGAARFIARPIDPAELVREIDECLASDGRTGP